MSRQSRLRLVSSCRQESIAHIVQVFTIGVLRTRCVLLQVHWLVPIGPASRVAQNATGTPSSTQLKRPPHASPTLGCHRRSHLSLGICLLTGLVYHYSCFHAQPHNPPPVLPTCDNVEFCRERGHHSLKVQPVVPHWQSQRVHSCPVPR